MFKGSAAADGSRGPLFPQGGLRRGFRLSRFSKDTWAGTLRAPSGLTASSERSRRPRWARRPIRMAPAPASQARGERAAPAPKASLDPARPSSLRVVASSTPRRPRPPGPLRSSGLQARSRHSCVLHTAARCDQQMFCVNSGINYALKTRPWPDPAPGLGEVRGGRRGNGLREVSSVVFQSRRCWLRGDPARSWGHTSL